MPAKKSEKKAEARKPRLMYATPTEKHYANGLVEYLQDDGKTWKADESNVFETPDLGGSGQ